VARSPPAEKDAGRLWVVESFSPATPQRPCTTRRPRPSASETKGTPEGGVRRVLPRITRPRGGRTVGDKRRPRWPARTNPARSRSGTAKAVRARGTDVGGSAAAVGRAQVGGPTGRPVGHDTLSMIGTAPCRACCRLRGARAGRGSPSSRRARAGGPLELAFGLLVLVTPPVSTKGKAKVIREKEEWRKKVRVNKWI